MQLPIMNLNDHKGNLSLLILSQLEAVEHDYSQAPPEQLCLGSVITTKSGHQMHVKEEPEEILAALEDMAGVPPKDPTPSESSPDTAPAPAAAASGRMGAQQEANEQARASERSHPHVERSGSADGSPPPTDPS